MHANAPFLRGNVHDPDSHLCQGHLVPICDKKCFLHVSVLPILHAELSLSYVRINRKPLGMGGALWTIAVRRFRSNYHGGELHVKEAFQP